MLDGLWKSPRFSHKGRFYDIQNAALEPKPLRWPRPTIYAGGESEAAKTLISQQCDAYVMHGDPPERVAAKIADLRTRRERTGLAPMTFGVAGYANYQQWISHTQLEQRVSLEDYAVSNRGLRSGLVGTPEEVLNRVLEFDESGVDLLLLQCSPQLEEMERFARQVIAPYRDRQSRSALVTRRSGISQMIATVAKNSHAR